MTTQLCESTMTANQVLPFQRSAVRMATPSLPEQLFIEVSIQLVTIDCEWVPAGDGSLYLRPVMFATQAQLGVHENMIAVIASPVESGESVTEASQFTNNGESSMSKCIPAAIAVIVLCSAAHAKDTPHGPKAALAELCQIEVKGESGDGWMRAPEAATSVTQHRLTVSRAPIDYTATAGTLVLRDNDDKPIANMGYIAYTKDSMKEPSERPIMFAFNGGPGSSSMYLHMGLLGPQRVVVSDAVPTPPAPFHIVQNEYGMLEKSDIVLIDPIGTGLSRAVCNHKDEEFWGVDADIDSIGRFIAQFVSDNNRWSSPKYLLGESYGTTRAAAITNYLRARYSLTFNGLILISVATDIEAIFASIPGNDRPYALYLPGYAAVAWYQHTLPQQPPALEPFLEEVRAYATGPYMAALGKGDKLEESELSEAAERIHNYTGLSVEYLKAAKLRVPESAFTQELLRSRGQTVSRLDARFVGSTLDPLEKRAAYDPEYSATLPAYTAAFLDYYHGTLKAGQGRTYRTTNYAIGEKWVWTHRPIGSTREQPAVNSGVDLAQALIQDPNLHVLVLSGYYDLATPFSATEYMMSHLGIPAEAGARIQMRYYEAGHLMYLHPPSLRKMKFDFDAFLDATAHP